MRIWYQVIDSLHSDPHSEIKCKPIRQVPRTKSVSVHIDENLIWNVHIDELSKKIASGFGALKRVRCFVHSTTLQYNLFSILCFNLILIIAASSGITATQPTPLSFENYKIEQQEF